MKLTLTQHQLNEIEVQIHNTSDDKERKRLKGILKLKYVEL